MDDEYAEKNVLTREMLTSTLQRSLEQDNHENANEKWGWENDDRMTEEEWGKLKETFLPAIKYSLV